MSKGAFIYDVRTKLREGGDQNNPNVWNNSISNSVMIVIFDCRENSDVRRCFPIQTLILLVLCFICNFFLVIYPTDSCVGGWVGRSLALPLLPLFLLLILLSNGSVGSLFPFVDGRTNQRKNERSEDRPAKSECLFGQVVLYLSSTRFSAHFL